MTDMPVIQIGSDCLGLGKAVKGAAGLIAKIIVLRCDNPAVRQRKKNKAQKLRIKGELDNQRILSKSGLKPKMVEPLREVIASELDSENSAKIVMGALPAIGEDSPSDDIDLEWLALFFEHSRNVFDEDLQAAWSRVLSSEANKPGSVPKRVLFTLSGLSKVEAESFLALQKASPYGRDLFVFDDACGYYPKHGLNFNFLIEAGLIARKAIGPTMRSVPIDDDVEIGSASRSPLVLCIADDALHVYLIKQPSGVIDIGSAYQMPMGCMEYTPQGLSLANTVEAVQFSDYAEFLKSELEKQEKYVAKVELIKDGRIKINERLRNGNE